MIVFKTHLVSLACLIATLVVSSSPAVVVATTDVVDDTPEQHSSMTMVANNNDQHSASLTWGKRTVPASTDQEDEDEEELFETSIVLHLEGLDIADLTPEQVAYLQDLILYTFSKVSRDDDDIRLIATHYATSGDESGGPSDNGDESITTQDGHLLLRRGSRSHRRRRGWMGFFGGGACRLCNGGDRLASTTNQNVFFWNRSDLVQKWQSAIADAVKNSRFDTFADVSDVTLDTEIDLSLYMAKQAQAKTQNEVLLRTN